MYLANLSLPGFIGNTEIFDNINVPFHKVDDDWCLDREEESRSRLEERGGALDGYIKGWNRWTSNVIIIDTGPMPKTIMIKLIRQMTRLAIMIMMMIKITIDHHEHQAGQR